MSSMQANGKIANFSAMIRTIFSWRMLIVFLMGFSSGLPLLLVGGTLKAWFTEAGVDLTTIGLFSLVGLPYTLKFIWSPFLDRYIPPFLGRRRGWLFVTQIGLAAALVALSFSDPALSTEWIAMVALLIAFFSATQDIALDAYRREILEREEFGLGSSWSIMGYRLAMLFAGAFALFLADHLSWSSVYLIMAATMGIGLLTTLLAPEPRIGPHPPASMKEAFIEPFLDYLKRPGSLWILAFILLYKVGDAMAGEMTMPFYLQLGFSKTDIAKIVKLYGIWATIAGGFVGGALMLRIGLIRALWFFGVLQAISTFGFAWLSNIGPRENALIGVITFENLSAGMGTAAYVAFMASLTNKRFSATQYALLSSLMGVPRVIIGAPTGWMAENMGWYAFFLICSLIAIPGLLLLTKIGKWSEPPDEDAAAQPTDPTDPTDPIETGAAGVG